jgi:hypothetical protein
VYGWSKTYDYQSDQISLTSILTLGNCVSSQYLLPIRFAFVCLSLPVFCHCIS